MQNFANISKFSIFTRSEQLPFVSRVNAILGHILRPNRETDPDRRRLYFARKPMLDFQIIQVPL